MARSTRDQTEALERALGYFGRAPYFMCYPIQGRAEVDTSRAWVGADYRWWYIGPRSQEVYRRMECWIITPATLPPRVFKSWSEFAEWRGNRSVVWANLVVRAVLPVERTSIPARPEKRPKQK